MLLRFFRLRFRYIVEKFTMTEPRQRRTPGNVAWPDGDRLDSWKEIATYMGRAVRTVQTWEKEYDLPVHRHTDQKNRGSVFAFQSEIDAWWGRYRSQLASEPGRAEKTGPEIATRPVRERVRWWLGGGAAAQLVGSKQLARFGSFELDLQSGELFKNGRKLKLPDQPFQVLSLLVAQPGEVVTREELRQKLWPADTFVDFDHSLNAAVNKLRETLGDSAANARYVETLPRRGYRFIAPVEGVGEGPAEAEKPSSVTGRKPILWWLLATCITVLVIGGFVGLRSVGPPARTDQEPARAIPLTSYPGSEVSPSFSPDGSQVAFAWEGENQDNLDIYVKAAGSETAHRLTSDPADDLSPVWSHDGSQIAFMREYSHEEGARVHLISPVGGREREIAKLDFGPYLWASPQLAWSPDGKSLAVTGKASPSEPFGIFLLSAETGERRQLTSPSRNLLGDSGASFSPDGGSLAFVRGPGWIVADIHVVATAGGDPKRLTFDGGWVQGLAWTPDGREILFSSSHGRGSGLWRVAASGGTPRRVVAAGSDAVHPAVSRIGNRLAFAHKTRDTNIWQLEVPQGPYGTAPRQERLIQSTWGDENPVFHPDGKRILFCSQRSGSWELWICDREGKNPLRLTNFNGPPVGSPSLSPDGTQVAFDSTREGSWDIYVMSLEGGPAPRRLTLDRGGDAKSEWSKDGKWIYFQSTRSGTEEIWRVPAQGGASERVTRNGGRVPRLSPDGKLIYYEKLGADGAKSLWKAPVEGEEETLVSESPRGLRWQSSAIADSGIYVVVWQDSGGERQWFIKFLDFKTGQLTQILQLKNAAPGSGALAISPDGRWFLCVQRDENSSDLMLIENFR